MLLHLDNPKCGAKYNHGMNCNINQLICVFIKILFIIWHAWNSDFNMSNACKYYVLSDWTTKYLVSVYHWKPDVMRNVIGQQTGFTLLSHHRNISVLK